ncbi:MAG: acetate/propionate family kinase [Lachnospiraceae bacterium]|nr:acetate/propionate family kinase [Candidatus Equihabitans merdae]
MKVLVCNAGSTSLKFKLFDMPAETVLAEGKIERVGSDDAIFHYQKPGCEKIYLEKQSIRRYADGIKMYLSYLTSPENGVIADIKEVERVGFKTVLSKGYYGIHELTDDVLKGMEDYLTIAPAHNIPYLEAIRQFRDVLPDATMIGAFETAFHTTIPLKRKMYGIPYEWYEKYGIERLGYHGASHSYVADVLTERYGSTGKTVSCHLGGSCSLCAIDNGQSMDNSFGMSLQAGIIHANRNGDIDPFIIPFLADEGMSMDEITKGLTKNGGLLGISGISNDLRYIQEEAEKGNDRAQLAIDVFVEGIIRYIGSYAAEMGGLDHIAFTGGIGEHGTLVRQMVCERLAFMGVDIDSELNEKCPGQGVISKEGSRVTVDVIAANEELGVCRKTYNYKK